MAFFLEYTEWNFGKKNTHFDTPANDLGGRDLVGGGMLMG